MGFVTGFTGGVTLTLAAAYLALSAHEKNRLAQSELLQTQTRILNTLSQDPSTRRPRLDAQPFPSRAELALQQRGHFVEAAKDKWNHEIESAVRWAQSTDWDSVRETAEDAAARALGIARDSAVQTSTDAAQSIRQTSSSAAETIRTTTSEAALAARNATNSALSSANERKEDLKTTLLRAKEAAEQTAVVTKEESKDLIANAIEKGRHMVGKAKATVHLAEEKVEARVDAKLLHVNEIEKALNERFEKPKVDPMTRSVDEVLAERYTPIDKRDNTRLRGI